MTTDNQETPQDDLIPFRVAQAQAENEGDPFRYSQPLDGDAVQFGRAICDAVGQPSGSPANYETLRGAGGEGPLTLRPLADVTADILSNFAAEFAPGSLDPTQPEQPAQ